jgi:hypothetical protein
MRGVLLSSVLLVGCGVPSRERADAQPPPDGPHCGNGVLEEDPPGLGEECDDGALNGTSQSRCTKQCVPPNTNFWGQAPLRAVPLDHPAKRAVRVELSGETGWGVAFTNYDDTGVHVIRNYGFNHPLEYVTLRVQGPTVALGAISAGGFASHLLPLWAEEAGDGFHLYLADVPAGAAPTIHELPYPFVDGTHPQIFASRTRAAVLTLDQSSVPPYDLLAALIMVCAPGDVTTKTLRVPAPGRVRTVAVESTEWDDVASEFVEQVVQFFDDTSTFVAFANHVPPVSCEVDFQLYESGRGNWPFKVVAATSWVQGHDPIVTNTHPPPIATMTDTGDVYVWQFVQGVSGEALVAPFGRMPPGTRVIGTAVGGTTGVWGLLPSGRFHLLVSGDRTDIHAGALMPMELEGIPVPTEAFPYGDSGWEPGVVADGRLWVPI